MRKRLAATIIAALALSLIHAPVIASSAIREAAPHALADLGNCHEEATTKFQGGSETDVVPTTRGVVSRAYVKNNDLCNNPEFSSSGSSSWVMLHVYNFGDRWYQVGVAKRVGDSCPHYFMQYNPAVGGTVTDYAGICASSATWYRFDLKLWDGIPDDWWDARVFLDSTNQVVWNAPNDPVSLDFAPEGGEFASEVKNGGYDQSGGGFSSRLTFDAARWYTSTGTIVWANMGASERFCQLCGGTPPPQPYNTQWYDGNTFEVWTDGF